MDEIDHLNARDERLMEALVAVRKPEGPKPTGRCLCCDDPLPLERRWCDADCRDDYEKQERTNLHR